MKRSDEFFYDLDIYRTPLEMKQYFETKKAEILVDKDYKNLARLKTGKFKIFLEEFYPLYCFSQSRYIPKDAEIKVVMGNQNYDGIISFSTGEVKKIELTEYIDGKKEHEDAVLLNERGYSKLRIGDTRDLSQKSEDYLEKVILNAKKKAAKDYSGVILIILINTLIHLDIWDLDTKEFIDKAINRLKELQFNADEVFLLVRNADSEDLIDNNIYRVK